MVEIKKGLRAATPPRKTFEELWKHWASTRGAAKRSLKDDESIAKRHLLPFFGAMAIRDIGVEHTDRFAAEHAGLSKKTVHNHLTLLIAMLHLARDLGWIERMPRIKKPRIRIHGKDFAFLRTAADIRRFLDAARAEDERIFAMYAAAVYTGARAGELAALRWDDIDLEHRLITIERSFTGVTKSDDVRHVPILDPLLPILRSWRLRNPLPIVFPNQAGTMLGESARPFQETLHRVLARAGFAKVCRGTKERPYIRFHDLRHTFASHWMMSGGSIFRLQKILGHKSTQMTMRYSHLAPDAFADDYGRLAETAPVRAEVVAIRTA
ncbi:MAG TPA: site-specific integrase [Polyangiaceae bacterium]|nr:site-specific integrase [Polyangiaceae bacterium]